MMPRDREDVRYDVVISGMGGAGLSATYEAAKQGKKILIVTDRNDDLSFNVCFYIQNSDNIYANEWIQILR